MLVADPAASLQLQSSIHRLDFDTFRSSHIHFQGIYRLDLESDGRLIQRTAHDKPPKAADQEKQKSKIFQMIVLMKVMMISLELCLFLSSQETDCFVFLSLFFHVFIFLSLSDCLSSLGNTPKDPILVHRNGNLTYRIFIVACFAPLLQRQLTCSRIKLG